VAYFSGHPVGLPYQPTLFAALSRS